MMAAVDEESLIVANSIKVLTQNGECQIDLCFGDITKLAKKDEVDVICVSAFHGNYVPTRISVIGALHRNLNIQVGELALDKEEDLRDLYSCWWSKPLPEHLPYKRLLCFETATSRDSSYKGHPQELVANVFRCLVPILNNKDGTVITGLLNTGSQGFNEVSMLTGTVEGAVKWMKAGLPLRLLKVVLYYKGASKIIQGQLPSGFNLVLEKFGELKERYEMQLLLPKAVPLEYDVYLSFCEKDEAAATMIREKLAGAKEGIRIYDSSNQTVNDEDVFQDDMYEVMMRCARVITVLTPNYLKSKACIEQYNIALCCNRRALRDMLAPFYVESVDLMPTYMGLVQYVDCRPLDPSKIQDACLQVSATLTVKLHTELRVAEFDPLRYDIFLSYCHRDTEQAMGFLHALQKLAPDLKIFFDVQELKTGKSWQRTLYHSIDGSRCMLALISAPYIKSAVCQEEFFLAQAKHFAKGKQHLQLIPICLEELESIPAEFSHIPFVKGTPEVLDNTVEALCPAVVKWLKGENIDGKCAALRAIFDEKVSAVFPDNEMESFRLAEFQREFGSKDKLLSTTSAFPPSLSEVFGESEKKEKEKEKDSQEVGECSRSASDCDIMFSYHSDDKKYVDFMSSVLEKHAGELRVKLKASDEHENLNSFERAECIVPILSPNYLESPECVEEFHIAIWRQRTSDPDASLLLPIGVHSLPQKPTYFHLVPCPVSATDSLWAQLIGQYSLDFPKDVDDLRKDASGRPQIPRDEALALLLFVYKILQRFARARTLKTKEREPRSALFSAMKLREQIKQITQPDYIDQVTQDLLELHVTDIPEDWKQENQGMNEADTHVHPPNNPVGSSDRVAQGTLHTGSEIVTSNDTSEENTSPSVLPSETSNQSSSQPVTSHQTITDDSPHISESHSPASGGTQKSNPSLSQQNVSSKISSMCIIL